MYLLIVKREKKQAFILVKAKDQLEALEKFLGIFSGTFKKDIDSITFKHLSSDFSPNGMLWLTVLNGE